jgi:MurNAc alpha-1-phosphate uridylyltransferase
MILAAGRGERMRPLTARLPKPMLEVGGHCLIEYHLAALHAFGVREVVVNLSWQGERIREALGDGATRQLSIRYSEEGPEPLGTAGGIVAALPLLGDDPFLVVNGDIWTDFDFTQLSLAPGAHACLVLVPNPAQLPRGDFGLDGDYVVERETDRFTYSGIGLYTAQFFAGCEPQRFPLLPLLKRAIASRHLRGRVHRGDWSDIGSPERLAALETRLRAGG